MIKRDKNNFLVFPYRASVSWGISQLVYSPKYIVLISILSENIHIINNSLHKLDDTDQTNYTHNQIKTVPFH